MRSSSSKFEPIIRFFTKKKFLLHIAEIILLLLVLVLCWMAGTKHEKTVVPVENVSTEKDWEATCREKFPLLEVDETDLDEQAAGASEINLSEFDGNCKLDKAGAYILSGKLNGCLKIDSIEDVVHIIFNGISITSPKGPAFLIEGPGRVVITLAEGTDNTVSDSGDYRGYEDYPSCIYSDCNLTINGSGSLTVNGYYKDAVFTKDILKIVSGNYKIKCKRTAFHGNDGIRAMQGTYYISTEKKAFETENKGSDGVGNIIISGGDYNIVAGKYSFVSDKAGLYIFNCSVNQKSIVSEYKVGKKAYIQEGCINE